MHFGEKIRKIRESKGLSQTKLAKKIGYKSNSYMASVEAGKFIPSKEKLKKIAKVLGLSFSEIKDILIESKIEEMGIKEKELQEMFREVPKLPKEEKRKIIETYLSIKEKLSKSKRNK